MLGTTDAAAAREDETAAAAAAQLERPPSSVEAALSELLLNSPEIADAGLAETPGETPGAPSESAAPAPKKAHRNTLSFFGFGGLPLPADASEAAGDEEPMSNSKRLSSVVMGLRSNIPSWRVPASASEKTLTVAGVKLDENVKKEMDEIFTDLEFDFKV